MYFIITFTTVFTHFIETIVKNLKICSTLQLGETFTVLPKLRIDGKRLTLRDPYFGVSGINLLQNIYLRCNFCMKYLFPGGTTILAAVVCVYFPLKKMVIVHFSYFWNFRVFSG
jgi:hypothetical protein